MPPRAKTVPVSSADVSSADVSSADVSSETRRHVAEGKLRLRRQRLRISSLVPITPRSEEADVLRALDEDRQEGLEPALP